MVGILRQRILYLAATNTDADLVKDALEFCGLHVDLASAGLDGLALQHSAPYNAIALSDQLADRSGIEVLQQLLNHDPGCAITWVAEPGNEASIAEALAMGVINYAIRDSRGRYVELLPSLIDQALRLAPLYKLSQQAISTIEQQRVLYLVTENRDADQVKLAFESCGYDLDLASSGVTGLDLQRMAPYDAIMLSDQLTDMSGIDVARQLLVHDPGTAITWVTDTGNETLVAEALAIGVLNYASRDTPGRYLELLPSLIAQSLRMGPQLRRPQAASSRIAQRRRGTVAAESLARIGFWEWDEVGKRCTYCSDELAAIYGFTPEEYINRSATPDRRKSLVHPDDEQRYRRISGVAAIENRGYEIEYRVIASDGAVKYVLERAEVENDDHGQAIRYFGIVQDITQLAQSHTEARQYRRRLVDAERLAKLGFWEWDGIGRPEHYCSDELANIYGITPEEYEIRCTTPAGLASLVHPEDVERYRRMTTADALENNRYEIEYRIIAADGSVKNILERGQAETAEDGRCIRFFGVSQDITQLVETQVELQQANEALRDTLDTLKSARGQLIQAEKLASLGRLVAGVAHEINTPLGVAITATSHLQRISAQEESAGSSNSSQPALDLILGNLQRASKLVSSFKLVAADQTSGDRRKFNLHDHLQASLTSLQPIIKKAGHQIELNCDSRIEVDGYPSAFYQIVSNLITNSIAHGFQEGQRGKINLSVSQQDDLLLMKYRDNGQGISDEVCEHIFKPFFTTSRASGSIGLGMNIVFNLVSQMGGKIMVENHQAGGLTFLIEMPVTAPLQSSNPGDKSLG